MTRTEYETSWKGNVLTCLLAISCLLILGCGSPTTEENVTPPTESVSAPEAITVTAENKELFFRYLSADKTRVKTTQSIDEIPKESRAEVVIVAPNNPTPPGWEFVADLNQPLPLTVQPVQGFNLSTTTPVRVAQARPAGEPSPEASLLKGGRASAPQAPPVKEAANKTVVMFSSPGCPYCDKARHYFEKRSVSFSEYDLERDSSRARRKLSQLAKSAGVNPQTLSGVPIIFVGKHVIRGYDRRRISQLLGI